MDASLLARAAEVDRRLKHGLRASTMLGDKDCRSMLKTLSEALDAAARNVRDAHGDCEGDARHPGPAMVGAMHASMRKTLLAKRIDEFRRVVDRSERHIPVYLL